MKLYFVAFVGDNSHEPAICHQNGDYSRFCFADETIAKKELASWNKSYSYTNLYTLIDVDVEITEEFNIESLGDRRGNKR